MILLNYYNSNDWYEGYNVFDIIPEKDKNIPFSITLTDERSEDDLKNTFYKSLPKDYNEIHMEEILLYNCVSGGKNRNRIFSSSTKVYLDMENLQIISYHPDIFEGSKIKIKKYNMIKLKPLYLLGYATSGGWNYGQLMIVCKIPRNISDYLEKMLTDHETREIHKRLENQCNAKYYGDTISSAYCSRDTSDTAFQCFSCKAKVCKTCYKDSFKNIVECNKCQCTVFKKL